MKSAYKGIDKVSYELLLDSDESEEYDSLY